MRSYYQQSNRIVIRCTHCKEKLRVPLDKGKIRVICPSCRGEFIYNPNSILQTIKQIFLSAGVFAVTLPKKLTGRSRRR